MSDSSAVVDIDYCGEFDAFSAGLDDEPEPLRERRRAAFARFQQSGPPQRRDEAWRFTELGKLADSAGRYRGDVEPLAAMDPDRVAPAMEGVAAQLCFINGRYAEGLSQRQDLPDGVTVLPLSKALGEGRHVSAVDGLLDRLPGLETHPFAALNSAYMSGDALVVLVAEGCQLSAPLQLSYYGSGSTAASYPRLLLALGRGAAATIIEEFDSDDAHCCCPLTEIDVAATAQVEYYRLQRTGSGAHLGGLRLRLDHEARAAGHCVSAGGVLNRVDIAAHLNGEGADCSLRGLSLVADGELSDYHVQVAHNVPHGSSQQIFRGVLDGKSRAVFDGVIKVAEGAQKTSAEQNSRNLLLSRRAVANSNPRLEILADDVQCAHGSTVGFLDPNALFYLRSRGLSEASARSILVYAFANEQLDAVGFAPLRERLAEHLADRFRTA